MYTMHKLPIHYSP